MLDLKIKHPTPDRELMKSSTQVFASLVAALATLSQSAISASSSSLSRNSIDLQYLSSSAIGKYVINSDIKLPISILLTQSLGGVIDSRKIAIARSSTKQISRLTDYKIAKKSKHQDSRLNAIVAQFKQATKVPILLPSNLPTKGLQLCPKTESDGYAITLVKGECPGAQASYVGSISATASKTLKPSDENILKVRLAGGITGYYTPRSYKVPPSIEWMYKGALYSIQITEYADGKNRNSTEAKAYLLSLANSAIKAGSR